VVALRVAGSAARDLGLRLQRRERGAQLVRRIGYRDVHVSLGYTMLGLVAFRLVWGLIGTRYARFWSFAFGPRSVSSCARSWSGISPPAPFTGCSRSLSSKS
jgi:hypothetical protein